MWSSCIPRSYFSKDHLRNWHTRTNWRWKPHRNNGRCSKDIRQQRSWIPCSFHFVINIMQIPDHIFLVFFLFVWCVFVWCDVWYVCLCECVHMYVFGELSAQVWASYPHWPPSLYLSQDLALDAELTGSAGVGWRVSFNNLPLSAPTSLVLGLQVHTTIANWDLGSWTQILVPVL